MAWTNWSDANKRLIYWRIRGRQRQRYRQGSRKYVRFLQIMHKINITQIMRILVQ